MSKNISSLSARTGLKENLFNALKQTTNSKDPQAAKKTLAEKSLIGVSALEGTSTFYDFLQGENAGKKAWVCNGTSCLCAGKQDDVRHQLAQQYSEDEIGSVNCLGRCYEGGAYLLADEEIDIQIKTMIPEGISFSDPVLLQETGDLLDYYHPILKAIKAGGNQKKQLLQSMLDASLKGRGGAGFPAGLKWQACQEQKVNKKYIVCNADEGDPGAFTDRYLLEHHPHSILFGMMLAGYIVGADEGILYIRDEYPMAIKKCQHAIDQLTQLKLVDATLFDTDFIFTFHIIVGAGSYVCGEETALLRSIEGQRPVVSIRPPFPVESGLFGQPTVVNNVETFACAHWIIENGGEAFVNLGTNQSAGIKLLSLDNSFNRPGVYEVPMGTSLRTVIDKLGGGFHSPVKALQIGGPLGGIVPEEKFDHLSIDYSSFAEHGFLLGHGSLVGIPQKMPILEYLIHLFDFTARESCGKCVPCRIGSVRGMEMMQSAAEGVKINRELLNDLLETMELGSLCALGGGLPLPINNALEYFAAELEDVFQQEASG